MIPKRRRVAASQSFTEVEVCILEALLDALERQASPDPALAGCVRKVGPTCSSR